MKKFFTIVSTLILLVASNFVLSYFFNTPFIELSFITGLLFTVGIVFFSTEGGVTTTLLDAPIKRFLEKESRTNTKVSEFEINIPFVISLIYTIVFGVISIFIYAKYF